MLLIIILVDGVRFVICRLSKIKMMFPTKWLLHIQFQKLIFRIVETTHLLEHIYTDFPVHKMHIELFFSCSIECNVRTTRLTCMLRWEIFSKCANGKIV